MLRLVAPRAVAHGRLLAAVLALVTLGVTQLGLAALLLGASQHRATDVALARATPEQVDATAYLADVPAAVAASATRDARRVLVDVMAPLRTTTTATASSAPRALGPAGGASRVGYLGAVENLEGRARFVAGRAPRPGAAVPEAALPQAAAEALGLSPGSTVTLGAEIARSTHVPPMTVRIVGVFRPLLDAGWERDLLGGAGSDPRFHASVRLESVPAFGPFVLDLADLVAGGSTVDRFQVTAHPDLSAPAGPQLAAVLSRWGAANARITAALHDRVSVEHIESALPTTLAVAGTQETVTRAAVLVVLLLGLALTATALALAGRLVAALRGNETALLASLGSSRRQLVAGSALEAGGLAAVAAALAVPLAGLAHAGLTHLPAVRRAGLATGPSATTGSVVAILVGAVVLTGLLVLPALRPEHGVGATTARGRVGVLVRSGADLLVVALAAVGWWQLRSQPPATSGVDAVRSAAPVLCLVAGALLVLRLLPPLLAGGDRLARRARTLVLPLATFEAARRPQAVAAALLVTLGTAAGSFGLAFLVTWDSAQHDQADLQVGTDLRLALAAPPRPGDGDALRAATGGVVSPAARHNVLVGQWLGDPGRPPQLVAADTTHAGQLLRGRPPQGRSWADVGAALAPRDRVVGVPVAAGAVPTVTGRVTGPAALVATPRLVLQDRTGSRFTLDGGQVRLDGRPHPFVLTEPLPAGTEVIALDVQLAYDEAGAPTFEDGGDLDAPEAASFTLDVRLPGTGAAARTWSVAAPQGELQKVGGARTTVRPGAGAAVLAATGVVALKDLGEGTVDLTVVAFPAPPPLPVAVSRRLADATGTRPGAPVTLTLGATRIEAEVVGVLPEVPSVPGGAALLADVDLLSRALLSAHDVAAAADAWWVGLPAGAQASAGSAGSARSGASVEERVRALGLGTPVTRAQVADDLAAGPLRVVFPVALAALVPLALLLVLAGAALNVTADTEARALELAQLRAVGVRRGDVRRGLLAQHGAVAALLVGAGAAVGAVATWLLTPLLVRSDGGGEAVPPVRWLWPWGVELMLLGGYLAGCLAVIGVIAVRRARRADTSRLRAGAS